MNHGKSTCNQLKAIRKQIADANNIAYEPHECTFEGECRGTCPACEGEMRYIERELQRRQSLGKKITVVGLAAVSIISTETSCVQGDEGDVQPQGEYPIDTTYVEPIDTTEIAKALETIASTEKENDRN